MSNEDLFKKLRKRKKTIRIRQAELRFLTACNDLESKIKKVENNESSKPPTQTLLYNLDTAKNYFDQMYNRHDIIGDDTLLVYGSNIISMQERVKEIMLNKNTTEN